MVRAKRHFVNREEVSSVCNKVECNRASVQGTGRANNMHWEASWVVGRRAALGVWCGGVAGSAFKGAYGK